MKAKTSAATQEAQQSRKPTKNASCGEDSCGPTNEFTTEADRVDTTSSVSASDMS